MPKSLFTDSYAAVAERLVELRKKQGISQVELARRLGKSQQFVSAVERRVRRVDLVEFYAVVRAIGLEPLDEVKALYAGFDPKLRI